jgi:hypothetical protein
LFELIKFLCVVDYDLFEYGFGESFEVKNSGVIGKDGIWILFQERWRVAKYRG